MGGFFLAQRPAAGGEPAELAGAEEVFARKGLAQRARLEGPNHVLLLYAKRCQPLENLVEFGGGDFVAAAGTPIYDRRCGAPALSDLYADFRAGRNCYEKFSGNACVILSENGRWHCFLDPQGVYRVFADRERRLLSSSLLAVRKALPRCTPSPQEIYEYLLRGSFFGRETFFAEIEALAGGGCWQLPPDARFTSWQPWVPEHGSWLRFGDCVADFADNLEGLFGILAHAFAGSMTAALSGGYDSRLMLALQRRVGVRPALYVYGDEQSIDVRVARRLCAGEGIDLDVVDMDSLPRPDPASLPAQLVRNHYFFDGQPYVGAFASGADIAMRERRVRERRLQLNGAVAEVLRTFFNLPAPVDAVKLCRHSYALGATDFLTDRFDREAYFAALGAKARAMVGADGPRLSRRQLEALFQPSRLTAVATNTSWNNQLSPCTLPYAEPRFGLWAPDLPFRHKRYGRLEAAIIRRLDPALAGYPSQYGHPFTELPPLKQRLRELAVFCTPLSMRTAQKERAYDRRQRANPWWHTPAYLVPVFGERELAVSEYVRLDRLRDPGILNRAYSLELTLSDQL